MIDPRRLCLTLRVTICYIGMFYFLVAGVIFSVAIPVYGIYTGDMLHMYDWIALLSLIAIGLTYLKIRRNPAHFCDIIEGMAIDE